MNAKTLEALTKHGQNLLSIFPEAIERDPVALCKKLRRIEGQAHKLAELNCNGAVREEVFDDTCLAILDRVAQLLSIHRGDPRRAWLIFNSDPCGYALNINSVVMRDHKLTLRTDLGGYGILAPDLTA